ncbi:hypothetical protein DEBA109399_12785 [Dermacoccus barathri]
MTVADPKTRLNAAQVRETAPPGWAQIMGSLRPAT